MNGWGESFANASLVIGVTATSSIRVSERRGHCHQDPSMYRRAPKFLEI